jgi:putative FmdB family regulatory protein
MPIYEYECQKCEEVVEAWQNFSDAPMTTCPNCQGPLRKLISASAFHLKGSGWYADGYSSSSGGSCSSSKGCNGTAKEVSCSSSKDNSSCGCG